MRPILLSLLVVFLCARPLRAAADERDIAVEFLKLQERILETQARFNARQAETRRLAALAWARAPDAGRCAVIVESSLRELAGSATARGPRARDAARLIDLLTRRLARASNLNLSALCPGAIGDSDDYNARSLTQGFSVAQ